MDWHTWVNTFILALMGGVGTALAAQASSWLRAKGYNTIILDAAENAGALGFQAALTAGLDFTKPGTWAPAVKVGLDHMQLQVGGAMNARGVTPEAAARLVTAAMTKYVTQYANAPAPAVGASNAQPGPVAAATAVADAAQQANPVGIIGGSMKMSLMAGALIGAACTISACTPQQQEQTQGYAQMGCTANQIATVVAPNLSSAQLGQKGQAAVNALCDLANGQAASVTISPPNGAASGAVTVNPAAAPVAKPAS